MFNTDSLDFTDMKNQMFKLRRFEIKHKQTDKHR